MVARKVGKILALGLGGVLVLLLLAMLAVGVALDRAPRYQAQIKEWVHQRIGYRIAFAHVAPSFRWYGPELYFDQLELRSKDGLRVIARAAGGRVGADVWRALRSRKLAARIELDAPDIVVERVAPDRFLLGSEIVLGGGAAAAPTMPLEMLPAGTLAVHHGRVTLEHWNGALPRLTLEDVNLNLRHAAATAHLSVDAKLPAVLGGLVSATGSLSGKGPLAQDGWTALARTRGLSFAGWRQLLPDYLSRLGSGTGGFEIAARGQGLLLRRADLDFNAQQVVTQLTDEAAVAFDQVAGALTVTHSGDDWSVLGRRVRALRGGRRDPDSDFDVTWRGAEAGTVRLQARASYLRIETLLPLAGLLPQKDMRDRLQEVAPTGEWMDTTLDLERATADDPWQFRIQARFRDVGFAPIGRAPGLRGLTGSLRGNQDGGRIDIDAHDSVFKWPGEFLQSVSLIDFKTTLFWKRTAEELLVASPSVALKTHDAVATARLAWHQPADGSSPVLVLASSVDDGNVADTRLYLPRQLLPQSALTWLDSAFVAGHLSHADVVLQGPIRHYPFRDGSGLFLARAHLEGMTLNYKDGWPAAQNVSGVAEFRNEGLSVHFTGGRIGDLKVASGDARFADFKTAELTVHTSVSGDAADALGYLRATPLDAASEQVFSTVEASGPLTADVDLDLPFKDFDQRHTLVAVHLNGVSLNRKGSPLVAADLRGDADIEGAQVAHADLHGKLLGGQFQMQSRAPRNRPLTRTTLVFNGNLSGAALHDALSLPAGIAIGGATDWHGVLRMAPEPARERSLRINSNLVGLELNLPAPLTKAVGEGLASSVDVQWPTAGGAQFDVSLGSVLRGQFSVGFGSGSPTLERVAVNFGSGAAPAGVPEFSDSQTLNTGGNIEHLDLAGWLKLYTPDKNAKPLGSFLRTAKFEVAQIDYLGLSFVDVAVDLAATEAGWRIGIGGPNVVGSITLPGAAESAEAWKLEFQRLKFNDDNRSPGTPPAAGSSAEGGGAAGDNAEGGGAPGANPHAIPAIDFHSAETIWGDRHLGDVRATLVKLDDGISLKQLHVAAASFSVEAQGEWRGPGVGAARIEGTVTSTDVGATLKDVGYAAVIEAKSGKLDFDMSWVGAPTAAALADATGHVKVALEKGQLTNIKPGAGRVVGLASIAALPRRLELDFSDLTDKGLAFDTARGDFDLRDGSAYTDNVLLKGPAAEIGLIGRIGLKNKDYDQTAVVTGNVSSTLPLAAFAAGPVVGGAVLLFTQVFKQPLKGLARGYYRITGNWDNPIVERIKSADAAAATAEATK